jgi:hypothetical protein
MRPQPSEAREFMLPLLAKLAVVLLNPLRPSRCPSASGKQSLGLALIELVSLVEPSDQRPRLANKLERYSGRLAHPSNAYSGRRPAPPDAANAARLTSPTDRPALMR